MSTIPKLKYPYNWGRTQVNAFVEKYARGTYFLGKLLGISPGDIRHGLIILLCRGNNTKFRVVKRVIVMLSDYDTETIRRMDEASRRSLYDCLRVDCENAVLDEKSLWEGLDRSQNRVLDF